MLLSVQAQLNAATSRKPSPMALFLSRPRHFTVTYGCPHYGSWVLPESRDCLFVTPAS